MGKMYEQCERILVTKEEIAAMVKDLAGKINRDYAGKEVLFVGILKGSFVFMADLLKEITLPCTTDFMVVKSYAGTESTGIVKIIKDTDTDIAGKHVIIVEDIVDTGVTLDYIKKIFALRNAESVAIVSAFDKPERRKALELEVEYPGIVIPNEFVVGYGLDYDEKLRNLPELRIFEPNK